MTSDHAPDLAAGDLAAVDELFAKRFDEGLTPGLAYAVVRDGELVHTGAFGSTTLEGVTPPGMDSVFRIASMSKSFTAAAILLLRDRGLVDLDEAVARYVPELVDQPAYSTDSPALTPRLLLTMAAGLPTDDPWGDRQESLSYDAFGTFLDGGFTTGREPGTGFEYSNLGYALLGRVIENVVGDAGGAGPEGANRRFVEAELLAPLGMGSSAYSPDDVPSRVPGHVKRSDGWHELDAVPSGSFAAMGGMHSSVGDLARWVGGFTAAFRPGRDGHPLSKASRRAMQQLHRFVGVDGRLGICGAEAGLGAVAMGYGYGLMVDHDSRLGQLVHHSGGYPGYGSRMVWHPATGLGVITLSNGTYAGAYEQAMTATRLLARRALEGQGPSRWSRPVRGLRERLDDAVGYAVGRLRTFDTEGEEIFADPARFADNVELDVPDPERRVQLREARGKVGLPLDGPVGAYWSRAMAHALVVVPAEKGRYDVEVLLSPEAEPRLQTLRATAVPPAPEALVTLARETVVGESAEAGLLRALGTPELLPEPVTCDGGTNAEFLVAAGPTWWKLTVIDGTAALAPHPTAAYERLEYLASVLLTG